MPENRLTYRDLQREIDNELFRYTLMQGQGGPLLFLWSIGIAIFLFILTLPIYVLPWTGAALTLGWLAMRDYRKDRKVQQVLLQSAMGKRFPIQALSDSRLQAGVRKATEIFTEIALKIDDIEKGRGVDSDLRRVLADSDGMISLQYESAKQAEEFERGLSLTDSGRVGSKRPGAPGLRTTDAERLHKENVSAMERATMEAREMVSDISRQLEVLMLQLFQLEHRPSDKVRTAEVALETKETLGRIQDEVNAREKAAQSVIQTLLQMRSSLEPGPDVSS